MRTRVYERDYRERLSQSNYYWNPWTKAWMTLSPSYLDGVISRSFKRTIVDEGGPRVRPNAERVVTHTVERREGVHAQATAWTGSSNYATGDSLVLFGGLPSYTGMAYAPVDNYPDMRNLVGDRLMGLNPLASALASLPFIGEIHSTIRMIRKPLSFLSALKVPKRYHQLPVGQVLSKAGMGPTSSAWLAWNYGWKPLFSDIGAAGSLLASALVMYEEYRTGKARKTSYTASTAVNYSSNHIQRMDDFTIGESSTRGWATFDLQWEPIGEPLSFAKFLTYKLGIRPEDIFTCAWELVPYSFVADWFLPIGKQLSSIRNTPIRPVITKLSYHRQTELYVEASRRINGYINGAKTTFPFGGWYTGTKTIYQRNTEGILQGSGPVLSLTENHTLSGLALIAQQLMCPVRNWKA